MQLDTQHMGKGSPSPDLTAHPGSGAAWVGGSRGVFEEPARGRGPRRSGRRPWPSPCDVAEDPGRRRDLLLGPGRPHRGLVLCSQPGPLLSRGDTDVWTFPVPTGTLWAATSRDSSDVPMRGAGASFRFSYPAVELSVKYAHVENT